MKFDEIRRQLSVLLMFESRLAALLFLSFCYLKHHHDRRRKKMKEQIRK
jgi:hypothetical protein